MKIPNSYNKPTYQFSGMRTLSINTVNKTKLTKQQSFRYHNPKKKA